MQFFYLRDRVPVSTSRISKLNYKTQLQSKTDKAMSLNLLTAMVYMQLNPRFQSVLLDTKKYNLPNKLTLVFNTSDTTFNCLYHIDHSLGRIWNMKMTLFFKQSQPDILNNNFFWINTLLVRWYRKNHTNQKSQNIFHKEPCISSKRFKCLCNLMDIP